MREAELILIRHGPTLRPEALHGRTDIGLKARPAPVSLEIEGLWVSPAARARETAMGLFPGATPREDARLWEQDFGSWEGMLYSDLPDVGALPRDELAVLTGEGGESFSSMVARVRPALEEAASEAIGRGSRVAVVAHAGTVRAALTLAMGEVSAALAFQIAHLGATRFRCYPGGLAVTAVNEVLA